MTIFRAAIITPLLLTAVIPAGCGRSSSSSSAPVNDTSSAAAWSGTTSTASAAPHAVLVHSSDLGTFGVSAAADQLSAVCTAFAPRDGATP